MKCFLRAWILVFLLVLTVAHSTYAAIPKTMAFQGRLTDSSGQPLDGSQTVTFRLYDAATGGTKLWEETQTLTVSQGLFSTLLGSATPLGLIFDQPYWVEILVGTEVLSPRQPLAASPYALRADQVSGPLDLNTNSSTALRIRNGTAEVFNVDATTGNIGIGTVTPGSKFHVVGNESVTGGANRAQLRFQDTGAAQQWTLNVFGTASSEGGGKFGINQVGAGTRFIINTAGNVGIGTTAPTQKLEISGAARLVPSGAPLSPAAGTIYYDATTNHFFGFNGTTWKQLDN